MTKRDYEVVAFGFARSEPPAHKVAAHTVWRHTRNVIAAILQEKYANFDREKFYAATHIEYWNITGRNYPV